MKIISNKRRDLLNSRKINESLSAHEKHKIATMFRIMFDHGGRDGFLNRHFQKAGQQSHLPSQTRRRFLLFNSEESPFTEATFLKAELPNLISDERVIVKLEKLHTHVQLGMAPGIRLLKRVSNITYL